MKGYSSEQYISVYGDEQIGVSSLVKRVIPNTEYFDISSVYPFLGTNLDKYHYIPEEAVSATIITNPIGGSIELGSNPNKVIYKSHSVVNLAEYDFKNLPENHKRNIKKSNVYVEVATNPIDWLPSVDHTYKNLIRKHNITGLTAYNRQQLATLLQVPGAVLFIGSDVANSDYCGRGEIVNYTLFYVMGNDAYYHFSCQTDFGYQLNSNFALMHQALLFFKNLGLDRVEIGAVPDGGSAGLARFKQGFATHQVNNYIEKRILRPDIYDILSKDKQGDYFPLYRS